MINRARTIIFVLLISAYVIVPFAHASAIGLPIDVPGIPGAGDILGGDQVPVDVQKDKPNEDQQKLNRQANVDLQKNIQNAKKNAAQNVTRAADNFFQKQLNLIEQEYKISNFLYYSDALTASYTQDFLSKYVQDPKEQKVIQYMIPQFSCQGNKVSPEQQLAKKQLITQKVQNFLGFDPSQLSTNDPMYWQKVAKLGDIYAHPEGWDLQLQGEADAAAASAQEAAQNELNSPGVKTSRTEGRDSGSTTNIAVTANRFIASQSASLNSDLLAGINNAQFAIDWTQQTVAGAIQNKIGGLIGDTIGNIAGNLAADFVQLLTDTIYTKLTQGTFLKGAVLIQEASTCLDTVQIQPASQLNVK